MITFTTNESGSITWTATMHGTKPLVRTISGTEQQMRNKLRVEYAQHVHYCVYFLLDAIKDTLSTSAPYMRILMQRAQQHALDMDMNHIDAAEALLPTILEMKQCLPRNDPQAHAYLIWMNTVTTMRQMHDKRQSLWVRGELETIDGNVYKPWETMLKIVA